MLLRQWLLSNPPSLKETKEWEVICEFCCGRDDDQEPISGALEKEGAGFSGKETGWVCGATSTTDFEKIAFYGGACLVC